MNAKVCLVTGANSGIGKATTLGLARSGATVVMLCRSRERGEAAREEIAHESRNEAVHLMLCDLGSRWQIRVFMEDFRREFDRLDVLVNNAGLAIPRRKLTEDGIETTFAVNHLAPFLLTNGLLDLLKASAPSRIVNVASEAHRGARLELDDLGLERGYSTWEAYRRSKLCNLLFTYRLAQRLTGSGVTANAMHPGTVSTGIWRSVPAIVRPILTVSKLFMRSSKNGADTVVWLAASPDVEGVNGRYFIDRREVRSSPDSHDEAVGTRLWEESARLTGLAVGA